MGFFTKLRGRSSAPPPAPSDPMPRYPVHGGPRFAVVDLETSGLSAEKHRVIEIAVVITDPDGHVLEEWETRVDPQGPVGPTRIHGITQADVAGAPLFSDVIAELNRRLAGAALVAHNANFDLAFLRAEYQRAGWTLPSVPALCTLRASEYHLPTLDRRRLVDCCWAVGTPLTDAHSALGDSRGTAGLLAAFMRPHTGCPPLSEHLAMPTQAMNIVWPSSPTHSPMAQPKRITPSRDTFPPRVQAAIAASSAHASVPNLVELIEHFSLIDALDEGASAGSVAYLEKLAEVLEDGVITAEEAADLADVADSHHLSEIEIKSANQAFVLALAHLALDDGKVTRAERSELQNVAELLGVNPKVIPSLLDRAEIARNQRMSANLAELPQDWTLGDPLRVGDKVAFTGCDDALRARLEAESERLGVRIVNGVSAKTAMLVTDGTMNGTKAAAAREFSTRVVDPGQYEILLGHLQPALTRSARAMPRSRPTSTPKHSTAASPFVVSHVTFGPEPAAVRRWARANGHEVGSRGRIHQEVIAAYMVAHPEG